MNKIDYFGMKILQYSAEVTGITSLTCAISKENGTHPIIDVGVGVALYLGGRITGNILDEEKRKNNGLVEKISSS